MFRSVTDCKHAGCWNQLIYWNLCTFVVEGDWCKILKKICFNVYDHIKSAHTAIRLHRVLCMSLKKEISRCICRSGSTLYSKGSISLEILM